MVHADEHALDPREEEHHDLPLALVPHHLSRRPRKGHSVSQRAQVFLNIEKARLDLNL